MVASHRLTTGSQPTPRRDPRNANLSGPAASRSTLRSARRTDASTPLARCAQIPAGAWCIPAAICPRPWAKLDELADGASFVLGHNLIAFDLPHLASAKPDLRLLKLPAVDTLMLSPLAFPRNPYHHLVKHYQDGGLKRGQVNDPELDARLALEVFGDELKALREADPGLLAAWHWLTTPEPEGASRALDDFFSGLRHSRRPSDAEASAAIRGRLEGAACATPAREAVGEAANSGWALAYALAWLSVAGGNSVVPPWGALSVPGGGAAGAPAQG